MPRQSRKTSWPESRENEAPKLGPAPREFRKQESSGSLMLAKLVAKFPREHSLFFSRLDGIGTQQKTKRHASAHHSDRQRRPRNSQQNPRINRMPQIGVRTAANKLVIHFQLDLIAPVLPQVPPRRDRQRNSGNRQHHTNPSHGKTIGISARIQKREPHPRRKKKNKSRNEDPEPQRPETIRLGSFGRTALPGAHRPINPKAEPHNSKQLLNWRNRNRGDFTHKASQRPRARQAPSYRRYRPMLEVENHPGVHLRPDLTLTSNNRSQRVGASPERKQMRESIINAAACFPAKSALSAL